ncbi:MAG: 23S rRNA (guanosine(2251)-2'-O)-methyltransferase RlmB [Magnetococcales bacterium]|nr:23S rRNA (guanosine(2251)-2'-O)-methyltransferase RlmB [Magnetococcales bacterium]
MPVDLVIGINPVKTLLEQNSTTVQLLQLMQGCNRNPRLREILDLARERKIRFRLVDRPVLDRVAKGGRHQGVVASREPRRQPTWEMLLDRIEASRSVKLVILDGVKDPHNLGAVIRSAEVFGFDAVVMPKDRSAPLNAAAVKASAGAGERMDVVRVTNLARALTELDDRFVVSIGLDGDAERALSETVNGPNGAMERIALVLGEEGGGLRRLTRERCTTLAAIPMVSDAIASLNVSVAAGISMYEVNRSLTS